MTTNYRDSLFQAWARAENAVHRALQKGKPSIALVDSAQRAETAYYMAEALENYGLEIDPFDIPTTIPDASDQDVFSLDEVAWIQGE
jgi:hypothetical protein